MQRSLQPQGDVLLRGPGVIGAFLYEGDALVLQVSLTWSCFPPSAASLHNGLAPIAVCLRLTVSSYIILRKSVKW